MVSTHRVEVCQWPPSENAPAGHWSWLCGEHGVGSVGPTLEHIAQPMAEHMRAEAPVVQGLLW